MGYLQDGYASEINTCAIFRAVTPSSVVIRHPDNFPTLLGQAIRYSMSTPRRASFVSIPEGIAGEVVDDVRFPKLPEHLHPVAAQSEDVHAGGRRLLGLRGRNLHAVKCLPDRGGGL